jgi:hypothetical protein
VVGDSTGCWLRSLVVYLVGAGVYLLARYTSVRTAGRWRRPSGDEVDHAPTSPETPPDEPREPAWPWVALVLYVVGIGLYLLVRYQGNWAETDSATLTEYIRGMADAGRLIPAGEIYPNGYLDQALSSTVMAMTGLSAEALQRWVYPLLAAIIVVPAWMTYRLLGGSALAASISTVLLVTLPDFLFVILRSSHEKFSRTLMLACLFLLFLPIVRRLSARRSAIVIALSWLATYALISTNMPLATSFIAAIALALAVGWSLSRVRAHLRRAQARFTWPALTFLVGAIALVVVFVAFIYPPAFHDVLVLQDTVQKVVAVVTGEGGRSGDALAAYTYVNTGWIDIRIYLLLSAANWLLLIGSFAVWTAQGWRWLVRGKEPETATAWVIWLLYSAFLVQAALAIVSDATGAFGSNLQLRLFPSFAIVAAALLGTALGRLASQPIHGVARAAAATAFVVLCLLSVTKATNEPLLSNKWNFYRPAEIAGLRWQDGHLADADIWTEFDERLESAYINEFPRSSNRFESTVTSATRDMAVSDVTRLRASRLGAPLPVPPDAWEVYDNGTMQLYHLRPQSPYQP